MAATMATTAVLNARCLSMPSPKPKPTTAPKPNSLLNQSLNLNPNPNHLSSSPHNLPRGLDLAATPSNLTSTPSLVAGAVFSALASCDASMAAQQVADIADGDNRGLALLLPIIPAVAWVLFNILQPALNQINRMRSSKGFAVGLGLGLGGWSAAGMVAPPESAANELAVAASSDNRGQLLLFVVGPAIVWVLYNILQPALNQINRMRSQ